MDPSTSNQEQPTSCRRQGPTSLPFDPISSSPLNTSLTEVKGTPLADENGVESTDLKDKPAQTTLRRIARDLFPQFVEPSVRRHYFEPGATGGSFLTTAHACATIATVNVALMTVVGATAAAQGIMTLNGSLVALGTLMTVGFGAVTYSAYRLNRRLSEKMVAYYQRLDSAS